MLHKVITQPSSSQLQMWIDQRMQLLWKDSISIQEQQNLLKEETLEKWRYYQKGWKQICRVPKRSTAWRGTFNIKIYDHHLPCRTITASTLFFSQRLNKNTFYFSGKSARYKSSMLFIIQTWDWHGLHHPFVHRHVILSTSFKSIDKITDKSFFDK